MRNQLIALGAGVLIGLGASKYQARTYFETGFQQALSSQDRACLSWWWGSDPAALQRAKAAMCPAARPALAQDPVTPADNDMTTTLSATDY